MLIIFQRISHHKNYHKFQVDLINESCTVDSISDWPIDFPKIHPLGDGRGCTHIFGAASSPKGTFNPFDTLCKVNVQTGETQTWKSDAGYIGEAYFVPSGDTEECGALICMAYRPDETVLLVLQVEDVASGPVAKLRCQKHFPMALWIFYRRSPIMLTTFLAMLLNFSSAYALEQAAILTVSWT